MRRSITLALAVGMLIGLGAAQILPVAVADSDQTYTLTGNGVITFIVDGKVQGHIDAAGLHINGDIGYSGGITDTVTYAPGETGASGGAP